MPRLIALSVPLLAAVGQWAFYYDKLPERVASHFGTSGEANDWMSRPGLFAFYFGILLFELVLLLVLVPTLVRVLPASLVNIPNRTYWLAPERKDATLRRLGTLLVPMGGGVGVFLVLVFQMVFAANVDNPAAPSLGDQPLWPALAAFFAFVAVWIVLLVRAFRLPAEASKAAS